jgi:hypothetical protein
VKNASLSVELFTETDNDGVADMKTLSDWNTTEHEVAKLMEENSSLRGIVLGYVAEEKLKKIIESNSEVSSNYKPHDQDKSIRCDRVVVYKQQQFYIEVKSILSNTIRSESDYFVGTAKTNYADKKELLFDDGSNCVTSLAMRKEFDILAVNCYHMTGKWDFVFIPNQSIPATESSEYTQFQKSQLLTRTIDVCFPPKNPLHSTNLVLLMDEILKGRIAGRMKIQQNTKSPSLFDFMEERFFERGTLYETE